MRRGFFVGALLVACASVAQAQELQVSFSTTPGSGRYEPAHVLAVWVESEAGEFQRTLHVWGSRRRSHLVEWRSVHPSSEVLDGISSATLRSHAEQEVTWDLYDTDAALIPDGTYVLRFEFADSNSGSSNQEGSFEFTKGPAGFDMTSSAGHYTDVRIVYMPPDAGMPDAGPQIVDAGHEEPDAGVMHEVDAGGKPDAGAGFDGGSRFDAGSASDASVSFDADETGGDDDTKDLPEKHWNQPGCSVGRGRVTAVSPASALLLGFLVAFRRKLR